jgi:hypothetical protein
MTVLRPHVDVSLQPQAAPAGEILSCGWDRPKSWSLDRIRFANKIPLQGGIWGLY